MYHPLNHGYRIYCKYLNDLVQKEIEWDNHNVPHNCLNPTQLSDMLKLSLCFLLSFQYIRPKLDHKKYNYHLMHDISLQDMVKHTYSQLNHDSHTDRMCIHNPKHLLIVLRYMKHISQNYLSTVCCEDNIFLEHHNNSLVHPSFHTN